MSQGLATHRRRDASCLQERAHLLRMNLTVRNEYALRLQIHGASTDYAGVLPCQNSPNQLPPASASAILPWASGTQAVRFMPYLGGISVLL